MLADVVVFSTGFDNDSERIAAEILGEKVAKELQGANGVDAEGEVRGLFRPLGSEYTSSPWSMLTLSRKGILVLSRRSRRDSLLFQVCRVADPG